MGWEGVCVCGGGGGGGGLLNRSADEIMCRHMAIYGMD